MMTKAFPVHVVKATIQIEIRKMALSSMLATDEMPSPFG
jgi:hypothetical protein